MDGRKQPEICKTFNKRKHKITECCISFLPRDIMKVDRVHKWKSNDPESVVDQQYSRETQDCHGVETVVCDDEHSPAHWPGTLLIIKTCRLFALIHHQQRQEEAVPDFLSCSFQISE